MRIATVACLLALPTLSLLPGCIFRQLGRDLEQIEEAGTIEIHIDGARGDGSPVVAVLIQDHEIDGGPAIVDAFGVASSKGDITLFCWPGEYLVMAFEDTNHSGHYEQGEPYAYHGDPTPVTIDTGGHIQSLTLTLTTTAEPSGGWANSDLAKRGVKLGERASQFAQVVELDDERFAPEVAKQGMWQPLKFIADFRPGLYLLEPYDADKTPIVFVHGISGSPRDFETIIDKLDHDHFQAWVFYYPSAMPLSDLGAYLFKTVHETRALHHAPHFFLVAHSMGGLVSWSGVEHFLEEPDADGLAFFATISSPLNGMAFAKSGVDHAPVVMPCWYDLVPDSNFLSSLMDEPLPDSVPYYLFFGYHDDGSGDGTVSAESQLRVEAQDAATAFIGVDATHMGILKDDRTPKKLNAALQLQRSRLSPP